jgi:hypothetical protein
MRVIRRKRAVDIVKARAQCNKRNIWRYGVLWSEAFFFMENASARKQRDEPTGE